VSLLVRHVRASTVELLRYPAYSLPTVAFPALLFLSFGTGGRAGRPAVAMAGFAAMAVLGVVLFQFGVGIAGERNTPWEAFLRVLPLPVRVRLLARVLSGVLFASVSCAGVIGSAFAVTSVRLGAGAWCALVGALLAGALPFALLGTALGYLAPPRAALPLANLLFLPLSYAGGLWGGPSSLPPALRAPSRYVPTRVWGDCLWGALRGHLWRPRELALLTVYGVAFAVVAAWAYRRDEGQRFT
jgi:ABC-2 type transport system permease protein